LVIGEPARQTSLTWSVLRQSPPTSDSDLVAMTMPSDAIWYCTTSSPTAWQASHSLRVMDRSELTRSILPEHSSWKAWSWVLSPTLIVVVAPVPL